MGTFLLSRFDNAATCDFGDYAWRRATTRAPDEGRWASLQERKTWLST